MLQKKHRNSLKHSQNIKFLSPIENLAMCQSQSLGLNSCYQCQCFFHSSKSSFKNFFSGKLFTVIKSQMDMLGSASLVHAGLTDLSGLEGLGDHLSHHHHAAAAAHHHYYAQVSRRSLVQNLGFWLFLVTKLPKYYIIVYLLFLLSMERQAKTEHMEMKISQPKYFWY